MLCISKYVIPNLEDNFYRLGHGMFSSHLTVLKLLHNNVSVILILFIPILRGFIHFHYKFRKFYSFARCFDHAREIILI